MEEFFLEKDEILLFEDDVNWKARPGTSHLILTSKAIVFKRQFKEGKAFRKTLHQTIDIFLLQDIKRLNDVPQIKQSLDVVTIQTVKGILEIDFSSLLKARKFSSNLREITTGSATFERGAGKYKGALGVVDDTLGIDTVGTVKGIVENGVVGTVIGGLKGKKQGKKGVVSGAVEIAQELLVNEEQPVLEDKTTTMSKMTIDDQIDAVKKMKELLDAGILTQEEFDQKKKELLGL